MEDIHYKKIIKKHKKKKHKIIYINRKIDHDGYDSYGPESNLYDLIIYFKKSNDYNFYKYNYYREYWFNTDDDEPYIKW
tara:strand:- start:523 stop:759 length:237 start_codon:yes stop_codon:yes gene_type:complete